MKMIKFLKSMSFALLACFALSQAALAQEAPERGTMEGLNDPNPEQFFCQEDLDLPGCEESQACEDAVCAVDSFCCNNTWDNICISEAQSFSACLIGETEPEPEARFKTDKFFNDGNPGEVEVTITCNTGLPLEQTTTISEGDGVTFVVGDFNDGEMDCTISEVVPAGYAPEYFSPIGVPISVGTEGCTFSGVNHGLTYDCDIANSLLSVDFDVTKEWIDENPQFNPENFAEANYTCSGEQFPDTFGQLQFIGDPGFASFNVYPHWNGLTTCTVTESLVDGGVEVDSSDCQSVSVTLGNDAACTIVNTRLFEGIPTLSQYGLALLAMLMMGIGFVAYRRFV